MKNKFKGFITGIIVTILMMNFIYAAGTSANLEVILNNINIAVNGEVAGVEGANYTLDNGDKVPFSILYNGTTYLPLRKVSEILGKDVSWDGVTRTANIVDSVSQNTPVEITTNSRANPAGINKTIYISGDNWRIGEYSLEISLTEVIRGQTAENIIMDWNKYNDPSDANKEYILAKFKVKVLTSEGDKAIDINNAMFDTVSSNGIVYDDFISISGVEPALSREYYPGAEFEGYTYFLVDEGDQALARFSLEYDEYVWFKIH